MSNSPRSFKLKIAISLLLTLGISALILLSLIFPLISKSDPIQISAGSRDGKRYEVAKALVDVTRDKGLNIADPTSTEGSIKTIKLVSEGKLDLGLIQGGLLKYLEDQDLQPVLETNFVEKAGLLRIRQIDTLDVEPLHLLFKPSLVNAGIKEIENLRGKKKVLNLGEKGSGTHLLALQVLKLVRLWPEKDYFEKNLSYHEIRALNNDELPDAVFTVSLLRSPVAQYLIENHDYELIEMPYGKSLSIDNTGIKKFVIDRYVYGSKQAKSVETIGTTLLLVTNGGVSDENVSKLLEITRGAEFNTIVNRVSTPEQFPEYPLHSGVGKFASRNEPLFTREFLRSRYVVNGLLFLILIALLANLRYTWTKRLLEQEHVKQVEAYSNYRKEVSDVEQELDKLREENPDDYYAKLGRLRKNLIEIRDKANKELYSTESVDPTIADPFQRYINSVISSVENLLSATRSR